jgi:SAM-dependent methyltransferase
VSFLERFSDRVSDYARYRPTYPSTMLDFLADHGLRDGAHVLDAGSGTGILAGLLLDRGAIVFAVEPNTPMRSEAERQLGSRSGFHSIDGTAEATGLPDESIDLITAAQAFHWFEPVPTRREWARVLRPGGWVALIWNERVDDGEFSKAYRELANSFVDREERPAARRLANPTEEIEKFFCPNPVTRCAFENGQALDLVGLKGRAMSSSYWPRTGEAHERSMATLDELFIRHNVDGQVRFDYRTEVFLGQLHG